MTVGFVVKAALLLTDKRTWKVIGAIVAGVVLLIALPVVILTGVFERLGQVDFGGQGRAGGLAKHVHDPGGGDGGSG